MPNHTRILSIAFFSVCMLIICGAAELQSFDTPSGKIELDAPYHLELQDSEEYGCHNDEGYCKYGFLNSDINKMMFEINIIQYKERDCTFEKMIEQDYAIYDLPDETYQKVIANNLTFDLPGEWTTTNDGRKLYFEDNSLFDNKPYAVIDFWDKKQAVYIAPMIERNPDTILAISKSFTLTS